MDIRFYVDPETKLPHIYKHNVGEEEVEEVLYNVGEDRRGRDDSRTAIGRTYAGRYLCVIYVLDPEPESIFVVTAYELTPKALAAYKRRRKKKGGKP